MADGRGLIARPRNNEAMLSCGYEICLTVRKNIRHSNMSFSEILEEIPKLSLSERREIFLQVLSLEPEEEDLAICDHAASEGFAMLDLLEARQSQ